MADADVTMDYAGAGFYAMDADLNAADAEMAAILLWLQTVVEASRSQFDYLLDSSHGLATIVSSTLEAALVQYLTSCPVLPQPVHLRSREERQSIWKGLSQNSPEYKTAQYIQAICRARHTRELSQEDEDYAQLLNEAFANDFQGDSVDLFCSTLSRYAEAFDSRTYYGRIIAWYGPSGAGKSKGIDTLQTIFPTFTACFRSSDDPRKGWPPGDLPIVRYFDRRGTTSTAEEWVAAFLGAYFEIAARELDKHMHSETRNTESSQLANRVRKVWNYEHQRGVSYDATSRGKLFQTIADRASALLEEHGAQKLQVILTEPSAKYIKLWQTYCEPGARQLMAQMDSAPFCLFALDECTEIPGVEAVALRRIMEAGNGHSKLWFILLGTNASINTLVPASSTVAPSQRFGELQCLPLWCYFGYGQLAPPDPPTPNEALNVDYLRKVGRPLFATYRTSSAAYSNARAKLFSPRLAFDPTSPVHVLTAFSHRILLELCNTAVANQMAAESVNFNLRYPIQIDGGIIRTMSPSEPLLSLVACDVLNRGDNFSASLKTLVAEIKKATIDRGLEGELYSRLLIIRARDFALHRKIERSSVELIHMLLAEHAESPETSLSAPPSIPDGAYDFGDTFATKSFAVRLITLQEHLEALVYLDNLAPEDASQIRAFSKPYHVNVTHMVQLLEPVSAIPQTYLCELFVRGAAVQCCHSQPVIDGFFVAYRGDLSQPFDLDLFIMISWQSKTKVAAASLTSLVSAVTGPMQLDGKGQRCKKAELVLVLDLNVRAAFQKGNPTFQATFRRAAPITSSHKQDSSLSSNQKKKPAKEPKPWAGYAMSEASEEQPLAWCLNVRGHTVDSFPCIGNTFTETIAPEFNDLFQEVAYVGNATGHQITQLVAEQTLNALQPLGRL